MDEGTDEDIAEEISRQLLTLDLNSDTEEEVKEEEPEPNEIIHYQLPEITALKDLERRLSSQRKGFEQQLKDCTDLLLSAEDKIASCKQTDFSSLVRDYGEIGENEEQFRARMYKEIEAEDELEESDYLTDSSLDQDVDPTSGSGNGNVTSDISNSNLLNALNDISSKELDSHSQEITTAIDGQSNMTMTTTEDETLPNDDQTQAVVLYDENNITLLQKKGRKKMSDLKKRQAVMSGKAEENHKHLVESMHKHESLEKTERQRRLELSKQEENQVQALKVQREKDLEREIKKKEDSLSAIALEFEAQIYKLEKQTQAEKVRLKTEIESIREKRQNKEMESAIRIQSVYRGHRVRRIYGEELKQAVKKKLADIHNRKVEEIDARIQEVEKKKKLEEEERVKLEEANRRQEEEAKQKVLEEKLAEEEAIRIQKEKEAEEKRIKEEKRRQAKEMKEQEKQRKKEEKERLKREKAELERLVREKEQQEKIQRQKEEQERVARVKDEQERLAAEKKTQAKLKREKDEQDKLRRDEEGKEKLERQQSKQLKLKTEKEGVKVEHAYGGDTADLKLETLVAQTSAGKNEPVENVSSADPNIPSVTSDQSEILSMGTNGVTPNIRLSSKTARFEEKVLESARDVPKPLSTSQLASLNSDENSDNSAHQKLIDNELAEKELKASQYKAWMEERKAANSIKLKTSSNVSTNVSLRKPSAAIPSVDVTTIEAKIEERRQRWMRECEPWSQISANARNSTAKVRKSLRRPTSAARKQEVISGDIILNQSGKNSLSQVEAVQLKDLPGCTLSTLSSCKRLKAVSLTNCGISAIDSLDAAACLQYAHLKENVIDSVHLMGAALIHLNLSSNSLNTIRGFESCTNLRYLNLSHNKISKLANLGFHKSLHTLDLSFNDLISTKGLGECATLQVLDLSNNHLTSIDELNRLCLLQKLTASANNLMEIPRLTNCVLLGTLMLDDNSISSLDGLAYFWLPSLTHVNLSQNGILTIQALHGCYNLSSLDLSHNQLIDFRNVQEGLKLCVSLEQLQLVGNPVDNQQLNRQNVSAALPQLKYLNGMELTDHKPINITSEVLLMCHNAQSEFSSLHQRYSNILSDNLSQAPRSNSELLKGVSELENYYVADFELAENVRYANEYGTMSFEKPQLLQPVPEQTSKDLFEAKLAEAEKVPEQPDLQPASHSAKDLFEQKLRATLESTSLRVSTENLKIITKSTSPRSGYKTPTSDDVRNSMPRASHRPQSNTPRSARPQSKRSSKLRMSVSTTDNGQRHKADNTSARLNQAATKIQALWRGHSFRQRLLRAFQHANECNSVGSDEEMPEVDLSVFDFTLDDEWLPPDMPSLPQSHAVLPPRLDMVRSDHNLDDDYVPHQSNGVYREAWRHSPSPMLDSVRYPDPPLSSMSGEISNRSKREELITQDWGFKDAHTAELMMKRAKKLKYNAQRKSKLNKLDAVGRYEFQKKILETVDIPKVMAPVRKVAPKKEYFKALEEEAKKKTWAKAASKEASVDRTYEWIHTQVTRGDSRVEREERVSSGESQLPYMDRRVLDGGRTQLVGSPLEIMSVDSYYGPSSAGSHAGGGDYSAGSHHGRHTKVEAPNTHSRYKPKKLPHKATNNEVEAYSAWGSGKKRNKI